MTKVNVIEEFNLSTGKALSVSKPKEIIRVGERIMTDKGIFVVKGIRFPTSPSDNESI